MSAYTTRNHVKQSTLLAIHPSHLLQEFKLDRKSPINNIRSTLWPLLTYSTAAKATNLTTKNTKQAQRRSILLTLFMSLSIAAKRLNPNRIYRSQITYIKTEVNAGWQEMSDNQCCITVYIMSHMQHGHSCLWECLGVK